MLQLTGFYDLLQIIGNLYLFLIFAGVAIAVWKGQTMAHKALFTFLVLLVSLAPIAPGVYEQMEYRSRLATARSMFAERCKTAGEKIYKTVDGVDGIYLMKLRPDDFDFSSQFKMNDPYGSDSSGDNYLLNFLRGFYHQRNEPPIEGYPPRTGYLYIEADDPKDGKRYRYTAGMKAVRQKDTTHPNIQRALKLDPNFDLNIYEFLFDRVPAFAPHPRYGVTFDDISTHEEREYWIAGSSLKVVDLVTNDVIAERIGYMVDLGQGNHSGGRNPWLSAADNACPGFQWNPNIPVTHGFVSQGGQTLTFVEKVLKPTK